MEQFSPGFPLVTCTFWFVFQRSENSVLVYNHWFVELSLRWRHNDHDGVSNHQPHGCLLNRLFRRRSKKTSNPRVTGLCVGNSPGPVNSPQKGLRGKCFHLMTSSSFSPSRGISDLAYFIRNFDWNRCVHIHQWQPTIYNQMDTYQRQTWGSIQTNKHKTTTAIRSKWINMQRLVDSVSHATP